MSERCPLYSQKRTLELRHAMSALCQKRTYAVQQLTVISSAAPSRRSCHMPLTAWHVVGGVGASMTGCEERYRVSPRSIRAHAESGHRLSPARLFTLVVLLLTRSRAIVHATVLIYNAMRTAVLQAPISARLCRR